MFKNIVIYRIDNDTDNLFTDLENQLQGAAFVTCGPTQAKSSGWVPPRGQDNGSLAEYVAGQLILKLQTETRSVPKDAIEREFIQRCAAIEANTGRKPGKKESRDIKDEIKLSLLPKAFSKLAANTVWIDHENRLVAVDASSQSHADAVVTHLVQSIPGLMLSPLATNVSPTSAMAEWLLYEDHPRGFTVDRECELKASDESRAVVRYGNHNLDIQEIKDHIGGGKMPTKLALTWQDKVSFLLTDHLQLKKIAILDVVFEEHFGGDLLKESNFDADVAISTGGLALLISDLVDALGGEPMAVALP